MCVQRWHVRVLPCCYRLRGQLAPGALPIHLPDRERQRAVCTVLTLDMHPAQSSIEDLFISHTLQRLHLISGDAERAFPGRENSRGACVKTPRLQNGDRFAWQKYPFVYHICAARYRVLLCTRGPPSALPSLACWLKRESRPFLQVLCVPGPADRHPAGQGMEGDEQDHDSRDVRGAGPPGCLHMP